MSTISPGFEAPRLQGQASSYQHVTSPIRGSNMLDLVISNFKSPVDTSIFPQWGTPTTHQSLQASPSPFSESQILQGESGGASMQTGRALGTFTAQQIGKRSSHPPQILPYPESLTIPFLDCTNSFPQKCSPLTRQTRSGGAPNVRSQQKPNIVRGNSGARSTTKTAPTLVIPAHARQQRTANCRQRAATSLALWYA